MDSSILDFWAASGLVPRTGGACQDEGIATWPSCDSVLNPPVGPCLTKTSPALSLCKASLALGPVRQLRRKKALMQLCLASPSSTGSKETSSSHRSPATLDQKVSTMNATLEARNHNLTTLLTLSGEKLLKSGAERGWGNVFSKPLNILRFLKYL